SKRGVVSRPTTHTPPTRPASATAARRAAVPVVLVLDMIGSPGGVPEIKGPGGKFQRPRRGGTGAGRSPAAGAVLRRRAAVDHEVVPDDEAGLGRGEPEHGIRDLGGRGDAADGDQRCD